MIPPQSFEARNSLSISGRETRSEEHMDVPRPQLSPVEARESRWNRNAALSRSPSSQLPAIRTTYLARLHGPGSASDLDTPSTSASAQVLTPQSAWKGPDPSSRPFQKHPYDWISQRASDDAHNSIGDMRTGPVGIHTSVMASLALAAGRPARKVEGTEQETMLKSLRIEAEDVDASNRVGGAHRVALRAPSPSTMSSASRTSTSESSNRSSGFTDGSQLHSSGSEISSASRTSLEGAQGRPTSYDKESSRPWLDSAGDWRTRCSDGDGAGILSSAESASSQVGLSPPRRRSRPLLSDSPPAQRSGRAPHALEQGCMDAIDDGTAGVPSSPPISARSSSASAAHTAEQHSPLPASGEGGLRRLAVPINAEQLRSRLASVSRARRTYITPVVVRGRSSLSASATPTTTTTCLAAAAPLASPHHAVESSGAGASAEGWRHDDEQDSGQQQHQRRLSDAAAGASPKGAPAAAAAAVCGAGQPPRSGAPTPISNWRPASGGGGGGRPTQVAEQQQQQQQPSVQRRLSDRDRAPSPPLPPSLRQVEHLMQQQQQQRRPTPREAAEARTATAPRRPSPPPTGPAAAAAHRPHFCQQQRLDSGPQQPRTQLAAATSTTTTTPTTTSSCSAAHDYRDDDDGGEQLRPRLGLPSSDVGQPPSTGGAATGLAPPTISLEDVARRDASDSPTSAAWSSAAATPQAPTTPHTNRGPEGYCQGTPPSPLLPSPVAPSPVSTLRPSSTSPQSTESRREQSGRDETFREGGSSVSAPSSCRSDEPLALPFDDTSSAPPLIIDARELDVYLSQIDTGRAASATAGRIKSSIHVSLPRLIQRRLLRACASDPSSTVSFPLKSFVTTQMGKRRLSEVVEAATISRHTSKRHAAVSSRDPTSDLVAVPSSPELDSIFWKADVVVVFEGPDTADSQGGALKPEPAREGDSGQVLLRALERVGAREGADRGGGLYYLNERLADAKAKLGPRYWIHGEDEDESDDSSAPPPALWPTLHSSPSPQETSRSLGPALRTEGRAQRGPSDGLCPPISLRTTSTGQPSLRATRSLSPISPSPSQPAAVGLQPQGDSALSLRVPTQLGDMELSPPPSLSPIAARPARPARPSLARLDTSERVKLTESASGAARSLTKRSPNGVRLQLDTTVPGRSATLSALEAPRLSFSRGNSPKAAAFGLPLSPVASGNKVPPTPAHTQSLQTLCRLQSQQPPSASSFGDMSLPPGARGTFGFGAHDHQGQPYPADLDFEVSTILPGFLYLGPNIQTAADVEQLRKTGVKRILNMAYEIEDGGADLNLAATFEKYLKIPMTDSVEAVGVQKSLLEACRFLDDARLHSAPVYVHCKAGKSRSVTVVMAYLIHANHWTLRKSYNFVVERRNAISPNIGFVAELMKFEERELDLTKSGGIVGGDLEDDASGEGRKDEPTEGKKSRGREHVRESMPPLSRETLAELSGLGPSASAPEMPHFDQRVGPQDPSPHRERETSHSSTISSSSQSPFGFADPIASLGSGERQTKITEVGEVRGSDGRYRSRRPPPVDEVNLAPGRRATMAGLGK